jgi:hypothetical protein
MAATDTSPATTTVDTSRCENDVGAWVDVAYNALFLVEHPNMQYAESYTEDAELRASIERSDPAKLMAVLRDCVRVVNGAPMGMPEWVRYKCDLLEHETEWDEAMFSWKPQQPPTQLPGGFTPTRGLDVLWSKLEAMPVARQLRACYVLYLAFENAWIGPSLPSLYEALTV